MNSANLDFLPWHDRTEGRTPTLIFLHYWGGSARTWAPVTQRLAGRDSVTIDARGWGRSRALPGPYSLSQLAEDVLAVIAVAGVTDYVLVGHSMGGKVAQLIAGTQPTGLRGVVFVGSGPAKPPAMITTEYQQTLSHAYDTDESRAFARDHVLTATALPDQLKTQVAEDSAASADGARTEWPLRGIAQDVSEHTIKIVVPTLVVAGDHDQVEPVQFQQDDLMPYLADARLEVIHDTGHLIPLEQPDALSRQIDEFADRVTN